MLFYSIRNSVHEHDRLVLSLLLAGVFFCRSDGSVLFYSIRPSAGPAVPLTGMGIEEDLPLQPVDEELLGQIDGVESGEVTGWACLRGYMARPLEVRALCGFCKNRLVGTVEQC